MSEDSENTGYDDLEGLIEPLRRVHAEIRDAVIRSTEEQGVEALSRVAEDMAGDTIYAIDRVSETVLVEVLERELCAETPIVYPPVAALIPSAEATNKKSRRFISFWFIFHSSFSS